MYHRINILKAIEFKNNIMVHTIMIRSNIQIYQYANIPIYQYANILIYQCNKIPMYECTNISILSVVGEFDRVRQTGLSHFDKNK